MSEVLKEARKKVAKCGEEMAQAGLVIGTWGNISTYLPEEGLVIITPSGMGYDTLEPKDMVVLDLAGDIKEGSRKPSIETPLHLAIYKARPDIKAIVHTHSTHACAAAVAREAIPPILEEVAQLVGGSVEVAAYALPGTGELAINAVTALGSRNAVLLANHGAIGVARDLEEALKICQVVEKAAQVYILSKILGSPAHLYAEDVEFLSRFYREKYGQGK